jgi:hypothetical protein
MDPIKNPFSPGAGSPPPDLAGRSDILHSATLLLRRIKLKRSEKSLLLTGLRGVGKTVLLNEIEKSARAEDYRTILIEAHEDKPLALLLAPHLRTLLFELDRLKGAGDKVRRGIRVLKSFLSGIRVKAGEIEVGIDVEPEQGAADSGDLEVDLPSLLVAVAEAAEERRTAVAIFIDEMQYFSSKELSALIMAMHRQQQKQLPLVLIGAGLPILPALAGESKSYAERLFNFPEIGALSEADAQKALQEPVKAEGVRFLPTALKEIVRLTKGYPYFIQEWGYQAWNHAESSPIGPSVIAMASVSVQKRLDANFFRVRHDRLTPREKEFLRAMADLGPGPYKTGAIAERLGTKTTSLGLLRAGLIKKGMIYSPAFGDMAFTVPLFDEFMRRSIPVFKRRTSKSVNQKNKTKRAR